MTKSNATSSQFKVGIVGGCGHVGIPLGVALAARNHDVTLIDINARAVETINKGQLPFLEEGAEELLQKHIGKNLRATLKPESVKDCNVVVFVTGTPVDEHLNPRVHDILKVIDSYSSYLSKETLIVLRSTIYPGVFDLIESALKARHGDCQLAFCPERIVQGKGIQEIFELPQIVSANSETSLRKAEDLFGTLAPKTVRLQPKEAELAKLMTNSWRYLEFAIANQFYVMAEGQGVDFFKVFNALKEDYPRAKHFASPGLAAGPCLFKDTMQLSAFHKNNFFLGQAAMLINEGLPVFLIDQLEEKVGSLANKKVAILGMTFKANNDDTRDSLAFKLKKLLQLRQATVISSDPYLPDSVPMETALKECDAVLLGVPHKEYKNLSLNNKPCVDCWGIWRGANP